MRLLRANGRALFTRRCLDLRRSTAPFSITTSPRPLSTLTFRTGARWPYSCPHPCLAANSPKQPCPRFPDHHDLCVTLRDTKLLERHLCRFLNCPRCDLNPLHGVNAPFGPASPSTEDELSISTDRLNRSYGPAP